MRKGGREEERYGGRGREGGINGGRERWRKGRKEGGRGPNDAG